MQQLPKPNLPTQSSKPLKPVKPKTSHSKYLSKTKNYKSYNFEVVDGQIKLNPEQKVLLKSSLTAIFPKIATNIYILNKYDIDNSYLDFIAVMTEINNYMQSAEYQNTYYDNNPDFNFIRQLWSKYLVNLPPRNI